MIRSKGWTVSKGCTTTASTAPAAAPERKKRRKTRHLKHLAIVGRYWPAMKSSTESDILVIQWTKNGQSAKFTRYILAVKRNSSKTIHVAKKKSSRPLPVLKIWMRYNFFLSLTHCITTIRFIISYTAHLHRQIYHFIHRCSFALNCARYFR